MIRLIKLRKYVAAFDYGVVSICSFMSVVGVLVGIASASFTLIFSLTTGIVKKITKHNKKQK